MRFWFFILCLTVAGQTLHAEGPQIETRARLAFCRGILAQARIVRGLSSSGELATKKAAASELAAILVEPAQVESFRRRVNHARDEEELMETLHAEGSFFPRVRSIRRVYRALRVENPRFTSVFGRETETDFDFALDPYQATIAPGIAPLFDPEWLEAALDRAYVAPDAESPAQVKVIETIGDMYHRFTAGRKSFAPAELNARQFTADLHVAQALSDEGMVPALREIILDRDRFLGIRPGWETERGDQISDEKKDRLVTMLRFCFLVEATRPLELYVRGNHQNFIPDVIGLLSFPDRRPYGVRYAAGMLLTLIEANLGNDWLSVQESSKIAIREAQHIGILAPGANPTAEDLRTNGAFEAISIGVALSLIEFQQHHRPSRYGARLLRQIASYGEERGDSMQRSAPTYHALVQSLLPMATAGDPTREFRQDRLIERAKLYRDQFNSRQ